MNRAIVITLAILGCFCCQLKAEAGEPIRSSDGTSAIASSGSPPGSGQAGPYWRSIPSAQGYLSISHTGQIGGLSDEFDGFKLSYGAWLEDPYRAGLHFLDSGGIYFWVSERKRMGQGVWGGGLGGDITCVTAGPLRLFPRVTLGLGYRTDNPDQGLLGILGVGAGSSIWLGHHWQVALTFDRVFESSTQDSNQFAVEIRWASEKLGFPLVD